MKRISRYEWETATPEQLAAWKQAGGVIVDQTETERLQELSEQFRRNRRIAMASGGGAMLLNMHEEDEAKQQAEVAADLAAGLDQPWKL